MLRLQESSHASIRKTEAGNLCIDDSVTLSSSSLLIDHLKRGMDNKRKIDAAPLARFGVHERPCELFTRQEQHVIIPAKAENEFGNRTLSPQVSPW